MQKILWMLLAASPAWSQTGAELFEKNCAGCHQAGSSTRAPLPDALRKLSRQTILDTLVTGKMLMQAASLTMEQRAAVAAYLGTTAGNEASAGRCSTALGPLKSLKGWNGWSTDLVNTRFQEAAGLEASEVSRLKLKWAFGYPGAITAFGQPSIVDGRLFVGSADGSVYALDAGTGCTYWVFHADGTVRTAISIGPSGAGRNAVYFGDGHASVYAVDARTGELLWKTHVEEHPYTNITGAPKLYDGRLYVPVSAGIEEFVATNPRYSCCSARGSVVSLDARTGKQLWKTYMIPDPPKPTTKTKDGVQSMGPSGASVWSSPTIDEKRKVLYVGTGNDHSAPETHYSDAVVALDLDSGSMLWVKQLLADDRWNVACMSPTPANCPDKAGPDHDIGSSTVLTTLPNGKRLLLAAQKSGVISALDPDAKGEILWRKSVGKGGVLGGVLWGFAVDGRNLYAPVSDWNPTDPSDGGGMAALRVASGDKAWTAPPVKPGCLGQTGCTPAQMSAATVIPGVVFSGSMDGHLRAYSSVDGKIVWDFDTLRDFETVNDVKARGGSIGGAGPTVSGGMVYVNSGYSQVGGMSGNVLLAFGAK
ncbi:MAG: PQQ-binding-like beta-propeller repeat protein [Bryobacteraceae bacterium]